MNDNRKGYLYSFVGTELIQGSDAMAGLTGVKMNPKKEGKKLVFANGPKAYGRVRGTFSVEGEITLLADEFLPWTKTHPQWLDEVFDFTFICKEGPNRDKVQLIGFSFDNADMTFEGTDEIKVTLPGTAFDMKINGNSPVIGNNVGLKVNG